jgi:ribosomal protein S18 acetylase RimI-like enzyme
MIFQGACIQSVPPMGGLEDGKLVGFIAFREGWVDHLYILPSSQRRGIGAALLKTAQQRIQELSLWTFQRNAAARRFYEANGFIVSGETDGAHNEEKEPDVRYTWRPPDDRFWPICEVKTNVTVVCSSRQSGPAQAEFFAF